MFDWEALEWLQSDWQPNEWLNKWEIVSYVSQSATLRWKAGVSKKGKSPKTCRPCTHNTRNMLGENKLYNTREKCNWD